VQRAQRNCLYCSTKHSNIGEEIDNNEPERIIEAIKLLSLDYVVLTSVTRDDLIDGGANHFIKTIKAIKHFNKNINIEILTPDFKGNLGLIEKITNEDIAVFCINIETVKRLYKKIRPQGNYHDVLNIIKFIKTKKPGLPIKSSLLIGLGENTEDITKTLSDLKHMDVTFY